jgi:hypothetical protein
MKTLILSLALLIPACGSPLDACEPMPTSGTGKTCIQDLPAGLPCNGIAWTVGGVVQDPATYEVICGAGQVITRDADTCAAIKAGAESFVTVGCTP